MFAGEGSELLRRIEDWETWNRVGTYFAIHNVYLMLAGNKE
jgi:hypothetical protein